MTKKQRGLMLLSAGVLCFCAVAPSQVGDGRVPRWMNLAWDVRQGAQRIAETTHRLFDALASRKAGAPTYPPQPPQIAAATPEANPARGDLLPTLGTLDASQAATVVDQAYATVVASERLKDLGFDPAGIRETLTAYRAGDLAGGDTQARAVHDGTARTALEWVALRQVQGRVGLDRLNAFFAAHAGWPTQRWFRGQVEARMARMQDPAKVGAFFRASPPVTPVGKLAFARALKTTGHAPEGAAIARALFRETDLSAALETRLRADFGAELQKGDYKFKADRLLYKEDIGPAMRFAQLAGPDEVALAKARAAVVADAPSDKAIAAVPVVLRGDPVLLLSQIQKARRADKVKEAAAAMLAAPRDPALLVNADEWWVERRVLARKALDAGDARIAYRICAEHPAASAESNIEAEFHAGWIALRFLNDPAAADRHFVAAAALAETPTSVARSAYWLGRSAENVAGADALARARTFYEKAARHASTYYGQLARANLGVKSAPVTVPSVEATGADRVEAVRAVEFLYAAGDKEDAYTLATEAAQNLGDEAQLAALARVIDQQQDAHLALTIGKMMGQRGFAFDALAFPTFGIPRFQPLQNSASFPVVYSVARQESAFNPTVISAAGAKGLMQMIDATAKRTATKAGLAFDGARLINDAAFNAQLGAAHLGALLAEQGGSYILTFAAYNAGGGRVRQWIEAYGDPRDPGVDPVDWVERIPFTETRNYVQRVMANVTVYQARFAEQTAKEAAAGRGIAQAKL